MTTTRLLFTAWTLDPFLVALALAALAMYTIAFRGRLRSQAGWFGAALVMLVLALASPIAVLARGYLFSAHMVQHLLLVLVVPPLVLFSLPAKAAPRSSPTPRVSSRRAVAWWALGVGAMWLWHDPTLCDAASSNLAVSRLQTLSLLGMGAAFWWPIFAPRARDRLAPFAAMVYLFTACLACTVLGIMVTFSPIEICSVYAHRSIGSESCRSCVTAGACRRRSIRKSEAS